MTQFPFESCLMYRRLKQQRDLFEGLNGLLVLFLRRCFDQRVLWGFWYWSGSLHSLVSVDWHCCEDRFASGFC